VVHPHEWGLIFGTPVPGYEAPEDTVKPYARVAEALFRQVAVANAAGRLRTDDQDRSVSDGLRAAVAPVSEGLFEDMPVAKVVLAVQAWTTLVGIVSLEIFGHWRNTILDPGLFFEGTMRNVAGELGLA